MIIVRIIKNGYGHKEGQVFSCSEFEAGHLMAFGYAVPAVEKKPERRPVVPPETRIETPPAIETQPIPEIKTEVKPDIKKPAGIFRRGRRKQT
jgi:hypothetical protein